MILWMHIYNNRQIILDNQLINTEEIHNLKDLKMTFSSFCVYDSSLGSTDGYFEMSLDDSVEELVGPSFMSLPAPTAKEPGGHQEEQSEEKQEEVQVHRVLWCYCVQVEEEEVKQKVACLVLADQLLGLLCSSHDFTRANQNMGKHTVYMQTGANLEAVLSFLSPSDAQIRFRSNLVNFYNTSVIN